MKKDDFIALGVEENLAVKCEEVIQSELKRYIPKSRFDEVNEAKKKLEIDIKSRDKQLEELRKSVGDNEELKKQIGLLQKENKDKEDKYLNDMKMLKIDNAVDTALSDAGAKNKIAVKALLNLKNLKIDDNGTVEGLIEQINSLRDSEETKFLFESSDKPKFRGFSPGINKEGLPDVSGYEQRLRDAMSRGNTLEAIIIKQEAKKEGIVLN